MKYAISRRRFLSHLSALGSAAALGQQAGAAAVPERMRESYADKEAYEELVIQPAPMLMLTPHWFDADSKFWYRRDGVDETREFILVDAALGSRKPAFDHARMAHSLSLALGRHYAPDHLPFRKMEFINAGTMAFSVDDQPWECNLATYACTRRAAAAAAAAPSPAPEQPAAPAPPVTEAEGLISPDGKWAAVVKDGNIYARGGAGGFFPLTSDAGGKIGYQSLAWSPDSQALVAFRANYVAIPSVYLIESTPPDDGMRGVLKQHEYAQAGDQFTTYEVWVFNPTLKTATKAQTDTINTGELPDIRWKKDGRRFTYEQPERGHQRFRVMDVDSHTGDARAIIDEIAETFINDVYNLYIDYPQTETTDEIIYSSEISGWRHLYLYNRDTGVLENQITSGDWVVREVDSVEAINRHIYFRASGRHLGIDPYLMSFYRVNFDGSGLTELTEGEGEHFVQWSPNKEWLIDTYSRADLPPVHTLRRASDGGLVCDLERADISGLLAQGWRLPEVFSAKGRDGVTDIWGIVFRPLHFDPSRHYPIIENIYAGPQDSFVRKTFAVYDSMQALAELGFIVVQCDGMGTRNRSRAFHDVCWHNLGDAGFPDRIPWITALAHKNPAFDLARVGIYGTSAGGQNSTGALLFHPEFYKVAVSSCGCHDNRIDKAVWNEQWMGYPVGPWYAEQSNIVNAHRLRGKLLLIVGELDTNVPPECTIRLTGALIAAGKDYELIIIVGSNHTDGGPYGERRRHDFFVKNLLGLVPPDRNIPVPPPTPIALTALSPDAADEAQAQGGAATTIKFTNGSGQKVTLYWLPGNGSRTQYAILTPGEVYTQNTYANHSWLIVGVGGHAVCVFVAAPRPGLAEIK